MTVTARELFPYLSAPIKDSISKLRDAGYDIAYGRYSTHELRKAVIDRQPAIIEIDGETWLCAGESEDALFLTKTGSDLRERHDIEFFGKSISAVIVSGRDVISDADAMTPELVIWTPERDSWPVEWEENKCRAKAVIGSLRLGCPHLPSHPVIVTFKMPTTSDIESGIRSMTVGPEITIYDKTDPVTEFIHELGHVFWSNRLCDADRDRIVAYHKTRNKNNISPIYTSEYQWKDAEEMFSTIYVYYIKGIVIADGYARILKELEETGWSILDSIVCRIREESEIKRSWGQTEGVVYDFLAALDDERVFMVPGRGLVKAVPPVNIPNGEHRFDYSIPHQYLCQDHGRHFILIESGRLSGRTIVLKADEKNVDFDFMRQISRDADALLKARHRKSDAKKEEAEEEAAEKKPTMAEVRAWLIKNPEPEDHELHAWAESKGFNVHAVEELAYKLAGQRAVSGEKYLKSPSDKVGVVMGEFKRGKLRSSSGDPVTDRKQAIAIAMSEARSMGKATVDFMLASLDDLRGRVARARKLTNPNPTENQKKNGNYAKGKLNWRGLTISIENPRGSYRSGADGKGRKWRQRLAHDYGYINRTEGNDGDHVDVFIGDAADDNDIAYVINQINPDTGEFDEHKVMIGFGDRRSAEQGYLKNYERGWRGMGGVVPMAWQRFREWLQDGDTTIPAE